MTFLGSVPLFKKQLPTSELPKVAQMLEEHTWKPYEKLVSQGAMGDLRKIFLRKFQWSDYKYKWLWSDDMLR